MGTFQGPYHDRVRYKMQHNGYGSLTIKSSEIIGWNDDDKEMHRNDDYSGIFPKFSNSLKFVGEAKDFINAVRKIYGINAEIRLTKEEKDQDDIWQRSYFGYLTMGTWEFENDIVSLKYDSGGLEKILKNREKEKVEIERSTDLRGRPIPELVLNKLNLPGRRIFLITKFKNDSINNTLNLSVESNAGNTRYMKGGLPFTIESQSHDLANSVQFQAVTGISATALDAGTTSMMFYAINDRPRLMRISAKYKFDAFFSQYENVQWCRLKLCFSIYQNGANYDLKHRYVLKELRSENPTESDNPADSEMSLFADYDYALNPFTRYFEGSFVKDIELLEGESMAIELQLGADMFTDNNAGVRVEAKNFEGTLRIDEDSHFPPTRTNGVMVYELLKRLVEIMTGSKNNFRSKYYGRKELGYDEDGPGAYKMFAHGHWIRLFEKGDELYKPFATSFKDVLETLNVLDNVGLGIETNGFMEIIVVEESEYFYNNNVTVRLGEMINDKFVYHQVNNVKRKTDAELYYGSVEIGSDKAGEYEEIFGLEESNAMANFTTPIESDNKYSKVSKHRWDSYGAEIIRRRNKEIKPTEDHSFDQHIFVFDVKKGLSDIYELKTWEDVLETEPVNMFDPDSAYNFLWSPIQLLIKHGWYLNGGLQEYPLDYIRFGSSKGKSKVIVQAKGKKAYAENGDLPIADLGKPRFTPEEVTFEYQVSTELNKLIEGTTVIQGKKIQNYYGLIEFKNEDGQLEKGRLISVKPNNKGDFTILKYNR